MQFYLAALDDKVRMAGENPSIGIIPCKSKDKTHPFRKSVGGKDSIVIIRSKSKDKTTVEYALKESNKPIGVAAYRMVSTLPKELKGKLPAPEQIAKLLEDGQGR